MPRNKGCSCGWKYDYSIPPYMQEGHADNCRSYQEMFDTEENSACDLAGDR